MLAVELHPDAGGARRVLRGAASDAACSPRRPTATPSASRRRWSITRDEIDWALEQFDAVLTKQI